MDLDKLEHAKLLKSARPNLGELVLFVGPSIDAYVKGHLPYLNDTIGDSELRYTILAIFQSRTSDNPDITSFHLQYPLAIQTSEKYGTTLLRFPPQIKSLTRTEKDVGSNHILCLYDNATRIAVGLFNAKQVMNKLGFDDNGILDKFLADYEKQYRHVTRSQH